MSTPNIHPPFSIRTNHSPNNRRVSNGSTYVEGTMPPPSSTDPLRPGQSSGSANQNLNDIAGVLRRNQACLNCRRRKLKCDAVRPNCGTCVRSHRHVLKTTPGSNAVLACEYDDVNPGHGADDVAGEDVEEDDGETAKKKKKSGQTKRKTRKEEEEEETERLRKKIEALEAQLAHQRVSSQPPSATQSRPPQQWSNPQSAFGNTDIPAPSPTAFLEMLSSAATAQQDNMAPSAPGLRAGAAENAMMSTTWAATPTDMQSTGLTPFLSFADNQEASLASEARPQPTQYRSDSTQESIESISRKPSMETNIPSNNPPQVSQAPQAIYNLIGSHNPQGEMWQQTSTLEPSTRTEEPWRAVETVQTVFAQVSEQIPELSSQTYQDAQKQGQQPDMQQQQVDPMADFNEAMQQQLLMDLFWPGWPQHLPEPNIVNDLVEVFFDMVPNMPRLLHRPRFLSRLTLPPTHANFPHASLIHAVCAAAAPWCNPSVYERSTRGRWTDNPIAKDKTMTFALRQAAYAKEAVQDGLNTGNRLFDVVRAMIVLSRVFIDDTRMLECWAYSGLVSRMILPLGLNVRSAELSLKSVMLPPPTDAVEREERRVAVWMAFYHDTVASAASGWGTSIQIDELTVPLPVSATDFDTGNNEMPSNPQDLESPDFWTRHPVEDPFVMCMKAAVLINRVNRFVRKWKNRPLRDDDDFEGMQRPEFRELANAAACLQMSFPPSLRNPARMNSKKRLDIDLISAHMIPQAAIICLYEPFADISDPNDGAARRILAAAQSIVAIIQNLASVAADGATNLSNVMHSSASVCLVTAARTSLLFYRLALNNHDHQTAETHRMDIELIRMSLQAFGLKFKIGHHHSQLIEYFLDRATRPDYQKLQAHYPSHPRSGAPDLHPNADFGQCILNALNIKRGFWRRWGDISGNVGVSPFGSTPESAAYASSAAGHGGPPTSGSATGSATDRSARISRFSSDSPVGPNVTTEGFGAFARVVSLPTSPKDQTNPLSDFARVYEVPSANAGGGLQKDTEQLFTSSLEFKDGQRSDGQRFGCPIVNPGGVAEELIRPNPGFRGLG